MADHPVTNAEFAQFVAATAYVTTAEKAPDWEELKKQVPPGTPKPDASVLVPGSAVFVPPRGPVPLTDVSAWFQWTPGASWRHPEGPASSIDDRSAHPVVHVSWDDAATYATNVISAATTGGWWPSSRSARCSAVPPGSGSNRARTWACVLRASGCDERRARVGCEATPTAPAAVDGVCIHLGFTD